MLPRRMAKLRDPPGQNCVYIVPGDYRELKYRLLTFKDYPKPDVDFYSLSKQGFYYTGYKDRVTCFSCAVALEGLSAENCRDLSQCHCSDCQWNGTVFPGTVPSQCSSYCPTTSSSGRIPHNSVTAVFCQKLPSKAFGPFSANQPDLNKGSIPRSNSVRFPCHQPINPHMQDYAARLQTLAQGINQWPGYRINASEKDIAQAGFYYLGERDRVKCWYCNGGLQNWERDDDPWVEHAKWFPKCEFVLQQKGVQFVHEIVASTPNLGRPALFNPARNVDFASGVSRRTALFNPVCFPTSSPSGPDIIDPREKQNEQRRKIEQDMSSSKLVQQARLMGFEDEAILTALKKQYQVHDAGFCACESLVDALLQMEDKDKPAKQNTGPSPSEPSSLSSTSQAGPTRPVDMECQNCAVCQKQDMFCAMRAFKFCTNCENSFNRCPFMREHFGIVLPRFNE